MTDEEATAAAITAAAEQMAAEAENHAEHAAGARAEAEEIAADANERASAILHEAAARTAPLTASADVAERKSGQLADTAERLRRAAGFAVKAEASEAAAQALEEERAELTVTLADLGSRLAELGAERARVTAQLEEARAAADLDAITEHRNRIGGVDDLAAVLTAQQVPVQARLDAIGDGSLAMQLPQRDQKELYRARQAASSDRRMVHDALNHAIPDRPEAVADAARRAEQEYQAWLTGQLAAEQAAFERQERLREPRVADLR